jgi:uncharacterized membrane protein
MLRNKHHKTDPVWHVQLGVLGAIILQIALPDHLSIGSRYIVPSVELLLIIALAVTTPKERIFRSMTRRLNATLLIVVAAAANGYALIEVARQLLQTASAANGRQLILAALNIYLTNIIIFGLLYWEIDGGGPGQRQQTEQSEHDMLFPQNQQASPHWRPTFIDYLYVSSTNAMAFSPTDTLPLSRRAKMIMLAQAALSLVTVALVAARAVNILH